ncbi:BLUF domain-containing protein [Brevundimonas sp. R86498]|uniref:BLUF domain-containing protein n=1 Tax=Brevundimonas sp. R86498 TaxID=3093845 RepID=UPI0037C78416
MTINTLTPTARRRRDENPVHQLLYRSRSRDGASSALQMSDILAEARRANPRDGVTGVLTVVSGMFVQLVEGPEAALARLLERLLRDPRHSDLVILERRTAPVRMFGDWDMVSPRLAAGDLALLALLLDDDRAGIDAYGRVMAHAVATQERILEGRAGAIHRASDARPGPAAVWPPGLEPEV